MRRYYVLLCLLSLFFIFGINSKCNAESMWTQISVKNGINNIDIVNALIDNFNINVSSYNGSNLTRYNNMLDYVENTDAYMALYLGSGTNGPFLHLRLFKKDDTTLNAYCNDTGFRIQHSSQNKYLNYDSGWDQYNKYNNTMYAFSSNAVNNYTWFTLNQCVYAFGFNMQGQYFEYNTLDNFSVANLTNIKYIDSNHRIVNINNIDYYNPQYNRSVNRWYIGNITGADNQYDIHVYYEMFTGYNWQNKGDLPVVRASDHTEVYFSQPTTLYNQAYRIYYTYQGDISEYYYYYFTPYGINATSGDNEIYTGDNNNNGVIQNQINEDNQNFWESTYNNLFSMNSGDVNELYSLAVSYFPSGETPLTIYDTIFGSLNNEPDDFIIMWDDHKLNITWFGGETLYSGDFISSGSINFSKECRDNETLSLIKFWFNTFVVIGFLLTYYTTLYKCLCHVIGVVSEDYQEDSDNYKRNDIGFKL